MRSARGFTLIEMLVAVAIAALLLTITVPSFREFLAKKRVEGVASELATDLQYARSESVARNRLVQITFGANCYVIHALPTTAAAVSTATSCTQTAASTIGTGETELKTVQLQTGTTALLAAASTFDSILFDPVKGLPAFFLGSASAAAGAVNVTSSVGSWSLSALLSVAGRVSTCSPSATVPGYASC
jgi:type IV fimbrial biogenesis protein FimT